MVEGARLESVYTLIAYRGFESLPLRQYDSSFVFRADWFRISVYDEAARLKPFIFCREQTHSLPSESGAPLDQSVRRQCLHDMIERRIN